MLTRLPLRRSLPLLLGLFAVLYSLLLVTLYLPRSLDNSLSTWRQHTDQILVLLQSSLAEHLRHQRLTDLEAELANLGGLRGVRWAMVVDERLGVLASTRLGLELAQIRGLDLAQLRAHLQANRPYWQAQSSERFFALYPLGRAEQLGEPIREALLVHLDFSPMLRQTRNEVWLYLAQTLAVLLLLGLVLNKLYDLLIRRRLALIDQAAHRFAIDQQPQPSPVTGRDEIASLAHNFSNLTRQLHDRQMALRESERLTRELIDIAPVGLLVTDRSLRVDQANPAAARLFGCSPADLHGQPIADRLREPEALQALRQAAPGSALQVTGLRDGSPVPLEASCTPFQRNGQLFHLLLLSDISQRLRDQEQLRYLAHYDQLTGLANRNRLVQRVEQLIAQARPLCLLFLDLDQFKRVNDTLGHEIGDRLLVHTARRLQRLLPEKSLLARSGGDEFLVLLEDQDVQQGVAIAERLLDDTRQPILIRQYECSGQLSIGIAASDGQLTANELLRHADLALYAAKDAGRNRLALYSEALSEAADGRRRMELDLRRALDQQEFVLHYQPQVDNQGRLRSMEALLRWQPPGGGLVPPGAFIPVLEDSGLIIETTRWVFREACRQARRWAEDGRPLRIAVNLSPLDFRQPDLAGCLLEILEDEGTPATLLELEITESALLDAGEDVQQTLARLKAAGLPLLLDDFGTGYASLTYLQQFPFDGIKIDRQFVAGLPDSEHSVALVRGILTMAAHLGLHVVAEGVENERQLAFLLLNGCPSLQGYHFGKPADAASWSQRWQQDTGPAWPGLDSRRG